ncbi:MAG: hypothetical protein IKQ43_02735 [Treponema sp.]|nr:hypothetical protein [Treponema sp.]
MKAKLCLKNLFIVSTLILIAFAASSCTVNADPPVYYTITAADGISNGTVTADKTTAKKDETVTLTLTAADGYGIGTISVKDASNNDIATTEVATGTKYTFKMPEGNVTVNAVFKKVYTITVSDEIANGIVTADKTTTKSDETVTLTLTAADDYEIDTISVKDASNNDIATTTVTAGETYTFVMPESNVIISASFKELPNYTITVSDEIANGIVTADKTTAKRGKTVILTLAASDGYEFDSISVKDACNNDIATTTVTARETYTFVMPEGDVTVSASFKAIDYVVEISSTAHGSVTADMTTAHIGNNTTLFIAADSGYKLEDLSVKGSGNEEVAVTKVTDGEKYTFNMPASNVTVSASFKAIDYTVEVSGTANGSATADKTTANIGNSITLFIIADSGYKLDALSVKDGENNEVSVTKETEGEKYTFKMPASNVTVSASFKAIDYTVKFSGIIWNGSVTADKTTAHIGDSITLSVTPKLSYKLDALSVKDGENNEVSVTKETEGEKYTFKMPASDVKVSAKFDYIFNETMTVLPAGTFGTAGTTETYVIFGDWPQTQVKKYSSVVVDETKSVTMGTFTYYKGSDGAWYAKPYYGGVYYKVEPIKWRVLTDNYNGKKLLLAENILGKCKYYDYYKVNRTIDGKTVYPNNYKESRVRAYLNGLSYTKKESDTAEQVTDSSFVEKGFLQTAFTTSAQNLIVTTTVDNSARSTNLDTNATYFNSGENEYACENTSDKIFLLSEQEVTTEAYFAYEHRSSRTTTDYSGERSGLEESWFLRSPYYKESRSVRVVGSDGDPYNYHADYLSEDGIVPALCIEN